MEKNPNPNPNPLNVSIFTEKTKNICLCTATAIMFIVLFVISPLSNFFKTSLFMKILSIVLMGYVVSLSYHQIELLRAASLVANSEAVQAQLNANILCSYVFTFFIGLLIIFVFKSFFQFR
jgi:hypothetical protein